MILVMSPHLDDAVLSLGQIIASYPGAIVATAFAGIPDSSRPVTRYDARCGFTDATHAVTTRREEDRSALASLNAEPRHMGFIDVQYEDHRDDEPVRIRLERWVRELHKDLEPDHTFIPLGISHPDHVLLGEACRYALYGKPQVYTYLELPYRVQYPEVTFSAVSRNLLPRDRSVAFINAGRDQLAQKMRAVFCYKSQLWGVDQWSTFAPERVYGEMQWRE